MLNWVFSFYKFKGVWGHRNLMFAVPQMPRRHISSPKALTVGFFFLFQPVVRCIKQRVWAQTTHKPLFMKAVCAVKTCTSDHVKSDSRDEK